VSKATMYNDPPMSELLSAAAERVGAPKVRLVEFMHRTIDGVREKHVVYGGKSTPLYDRTEVYNLHGRPRALNK
jgi:hypothetical protein